jgi:nicotinamidase-related amidase
MGGTWKGDEADCAAQRPCRQARMRALTMAFHFHQVCSEKRRPSEHVVEKNIPDAFIASGLERWLRVRQIGEVVIAGVITNNSVESSARSR